MAADAFNLEICTTAQAENPKGLGFRVKLSTQNTKFTPENLLRRFRICNPFVTNFHKQAELGLQDHIALVMGAQNSTPPV